MAAGAARRDGRRCNRDGRTELPAGVGAATLWRERRRGRERADAQVVDRLRDGLEVDGAFVREVAAVQGPIADEIDDAGNAARDAENGIDGIRRKVHAVVAAAGHTEAMRDVARDAFSC